MLPASQWIFGPFRLDPRNACLWRGVEIVPLPPTAFALLHYLVTHAGQLVELGRSIHADNEMVS